jgi:molybdopterin/thiamine biosynthesis adenylyltransferase
MESQFVRHLSLKEFNVATLEKLFTTKVLVVGLGALGSAAAESLSIKIIEFEMGLAILE